MNLGVARYRRCMVGDDLTEGVNGMGSERKRLGMGVSGRSTGLLVLVFLPVLLCVALVVPCLAVGQVTHDYLSDIAEVPASSGATFTGPLHGPSSMTIDEGDLWLIDHTGGNTSHNAVDEFDASTGVFVKQLPQVANSASLNNIALGHSTGETEVYAATSESIDVFNASGTLQETWTGADTPQGSFSGNDIPQLGFEARADAVAVDNSKDLNDWAAGDVYVTSQTNYTGKSLEHDVVNVFRPEAGGKEKYVTQLTGTSPAEPFGTPGRVVVNESDGEVLVTQATNETTVVDRFEPAAGMPGVYTFLGTLGGPPPSGAFGNGVSYLAIDSSTGEIYVDSGEIYQFNAAGTYLGKFNIAGTPNGGSPQAMAIDPKTHHVFIGTSHTTVRSDVIDVFGEDVTVPDVTTGAVSNLKALSATVEGTVNPDKAGAGICRFEWGTTPEFGHVTECSEPVAEGENPVAVHASLSELEPDTTYYYRLGASNHYGTNLGEPAQDQQFTTPGPGLREVDVSDITAESATLNATINPHATPTTYYFQYGTSNSYGADVPVLSEFAEHGGIVGSGEGAVEVSQHLQGLQANIVYHFRVIAVSDIEGQIESFASPDQTFTTQHSQASTALPDGRQWELVTPAEKNGALFQRLGKEYPALLQGSVNGNAIADVAYSPSEAEPQGFSNEVSVLSTRGANGWSSQVIAPPHTESTGVSIGKGQEYKFFSEDLSLGVVQPFGPYTPLSPAATESTAYLRTDYSNGDVSDHCESSYQSSSSCFLPLVTAANTPPGTAFGEVGSNGLCEKFECGPDVAGISPDASHIVLESPVQLTKTPDMHTGLYEWAAGQLQLVSVLPPGEEAPGGGAAAIGPNLGLFSGGEGVNTRHAISNDGSRIIWEADEPRHLYLRDTAKRETIRLDTPQGTPPKPIARNPSFLTASSDGSRIFFLDAGLTEQESEVAVNNSDEGADLYEYDLNAPAGSRLTDLSVDTRSGESAGVQNVLGSSEDGSYVYFMATGALTAGAIPANNIYLRHDGATTLIARLSGADASDWGRVSDMTARVSPNGKWLAFDSIEGLTGYDTRDVASGGQDNEVYLYDASTNHLVCASCNPSGARPTGGSEVVSWELRLVGTTSHQPRYLSNSGRLFFESRDALVPQDVNGTQDVYEYEPESVGDCTLSNETFSEHSAGCVGLISSATSPEESFFLDASETGGDVFFLTTAKLLPQDFDQAPDVYDAHECTAEVPCFVPPPVAPRPCVTGDGCKPSPTPQPLIFGAPPSATFSGTGDVVSSSSTQRALPKALTRAQRLARALGVCRKKQGRKRRAACERTAKRKYGAGKSARANAKKKGKG